VPEPSGGDAGAAVGARRSRLLNVANVAVSQLDTAIATLGALAVTPAVLHGLGDAGYGGWLLLNSFIGYLRFLDLGTSASTIKFGAGASARGDARGLAAVIDSSAALFASAGVTAMIVTVGLAFLLPWLFAPLTTEHAATILVLGAALAIELAFRPFAAALRMRSLYFVHDAVEVGTYLVFKLLLVLRFARAGALSYRVLALLTLGESVTRIALVTALALVFAPAVRAINPLRLERTMIRSLAGMGLAMSVIQLADVVRFQLDAAVIGYFLPDAPESIAVFGLGARLPSIAYTTIGVISAVLLPRFSGLAAQGDERSLERLLATASLVTGLVSSFVLVNLAVLGPSFLDLWLRKPWASSSGRILLILLPGYFVALLCGPGTGVLVGRGKLRGLTKLTVAEAAVNFLLSVAFVRPLGVIGVALGTAVPLIAFRGVGFPLLMRKETGLELSTYARMHAPAASVAGIYLVLASGLVLVPVRSFSDLALVGLVSGLFFVLVALVALPQGRSVLARAWPLRQSEKRTSPL
jgi:O-antigen/teichoic acid export membrane protein